MIRETVKCLTNLFLDAKIETKPREKSPMSTAFSGVMNSNYNIYIHETKYT